MAWKRTEQPEASNNWITPNWTPYLYRSTKSTCIFILSWNVSFPTGEITGSRLNLYPGASWPTGKQRKKNDEEKKQAAHPTKSTANERLTDFPFSSVSPTSPWISLHFLGFWDPIHHVCSLFWALLMSLAPLEETLFTPLAKKREQKHWVEKKTETDLEGSGQLLLVHWSARGEGKDRPEKFSCCLDPTCSSRKWCAFDSDRYEGLMKKETGRRKEAVQYRNRKQLGKKNKKSFAAKFPFSFSFFSVLFSLDLISQPITRETSWARRSNCQPKRMLIWDKKWREADHIFSFLFLNRLILPAFSLLSLLPLSFLA